MRQRRSQELDREAAEALGLEALLFLAEDQGRMRRFLALTGMTPDRVAAEASRPELLAAVLDHLGEDESLLLVFAAEAKIAPQQVASARRSLREPREPRRK